MVYPEKKAADEHFDNLRRQYADVVARIRRQCDEATSSASFVEQSMRAIQEKNDNCEDAVAAADPLKLVENTSAMAR